MTNTQEDLKTRIQGLKEKVSKLPKKAQTPEARAVRKDLKRAQRKLAAGIRVSLEDRLKHTQKWLDSTGKILSDLTKNMKKTQASAPVHSLRKRTKQLNKRIKKINRLLEAKKASAPAAPAAPA